MRRQYNARSSETDKKIKKLKSDVEKCRKRVTRIKANTKELKQRLEARDSN